MTTASITYFALSRVSLHKLIGFKFFFLVWHHSWHLEKELWSGDNLSLLLLVVVVVVGGVGRVEHVRMVGGRGRPGVLGRMTEGEHVEGGGGRAVQHLEVWDHFLLGARPSSPHVLIEWL